MRFALDCTLTVRDWQYVARRAGGRSWENAARKHAAESGAAVVLMGDDTILVFSRQECGRVVKFKGKGSPQ